MSKFCQRLEFGIRSSAKTKLKILSHDGHKRACVRVETPKNVVRFHKVVNIVKTIQSCNSGEVMNVVICYLSEA